MSISSLFLILVGVFLNTLAQLCLKKGMMAIGSVSLDLNVIVDQSLRIVSNGYIFIGMACYVVSFGVWLLVLSKVDVSLAYPMLSIGYVATAIVGCYYMGEPLTMYKILGIITICVGTSLLFKA